MDVCFNNGGAADYFALHSGMLLNLIEANTPMTIRMGFRIALWAILGAVISAGWGFYFATADKSMPIGSIVLVLASITQPIAAVVGWYLRLPFGLNAAVAWNAGVFAVIGVIVETLRRHRHALGTAV